MATSPDTIAFIMERLGSAGSVSSRKMFGEYALYLDGKVVALVCDDSLFVKPTPSALALMDDPAMGLPYPGARPHILADALLDEPERLVEVVRAVERDLPAPKPKKAKAPKG
jgi:TfoX/Sxy family transcriptional regulator of competence genes